MSCRLCVRRFDEDKIRGRADEEFAESKFDDESLSRAESAFKSARDPWFAHFVNDEGAEDDECCKKEAG